jgi:hypothetical protein
LIYDMSTEESVDTLHDNRAILGRLVVFRPSEVWRLKVARAPGRLITCRAPLSGSPKRAPSARAEFQYDDAVCGNGVGKARCDAGGL